MIFVQSFRSIRAATAHGEARKWGELSDWRSYKKLIKKQIRDPRTDSRYALRIWQKNCRLVPIRSRVSFISATGLLRLTVRLTQVWRVWPPAHYTDVYSTLKVHYVVHCVVHVQRYVSPASTDRSFRPFALSNNFKADRSYVYNVVHVHVQRL